MRLGNCRCKVKGPHQHAMCLQQRTEGEGSDLERHVLGAMRHPDMLQTWHGHTWTQDVLLTSLAGPAVTSMLLPGRDSTQVICSVWPCTVAVGDVSPLHSFDALPCKCHHLLDQRIEATAPCQHPTAAGCNPPQQPPKCVHLLSNKVLPLATGS